MDVSSTMAMIQAAAGYSILKSANKQPELALQLLLQSLPLQTAQAPSANPETPAVTVQAPPSPTGPGQLIDIIA